MTDSDGNLKGLSWQGCPGTMIYRRDIAKEVFGTDDPAEVQKKGALVLFLVRRGRRFLFQFLRAANCV